MQCQVALSYLIAVLYLVSILQTLQLKILQKNFAHSIHTGCMHVIVVGIQSTGIDFLKILGEPKYWVKLMNAYAFSIIGGTCLGCPKVYIYVYDAKDSIEM